MCHMRERGPGWVTSREVATEIGFPWRAVARAMLRMVELERTRITWVSSRFRTRVCNSFRHVAGPTAEVVAVYPGWMIPKAHPVPDGVGRVIRMRG